MSDKPDNPFKFWEELKRRKVVRVVIAYAAAAFVLLELVDILAEPLGLPDWTINLVLILLCIGFVITVVLSWVYDLTPEGVQKTKPSGQNINEIKQPASRGWKISTYISALVIIVFVLVYVIGNIKQSSDISKLEKTIAVLPFENFSHEENDSHLGDAIANEMATQLVKIQEFQVRSFTSSLQYKGYNKPSMPQIGVELNANFIIEGSIELQNQDVSIHVQVIQAENDNHLWAKEFRGKWSDILTIRTNISKAVASELKTILTPEEIEQIERKPTENLEAYEYYLRGNEYYWRSYEAQDWSIALNMYQKAIELDSSFALAYAMTARSHIQLYWFHYDRSAERLRKCKQAIDAAFVIDPDLPEGYIAMGTYYYYGFLDYSKALKQFETALEYLPNNAECHYLKACVYRRMGEWKKAEENFIKASRNDPKNSRVMYNTSETYYLRGEYSEALNYINTTINLSPEWASAYGHKIKIYLKREGETKNGRNVLEEASLIINPSSSPLLAKITLSMDIYDGKYQDALNYLNTLSFEAYQNQFEYSPKYLYYARIYDLMEDSQRAEHFYNLSRLMLEDKIKDTPDDSRLYSSLGICYAGLNMKDKALQYGERAVELLPLSKEAYRGYFRIMALAQIYVMIGEYELALEQLDYLLANPGVISAKLLQLDPIWKPLWDLPGFKELIEKYSDD